MSFSDLLAFSAFSSRLPPNRLSPLEVELGFAAPSLQAVSFLTLRNLLLYFWLKNPQIELCLFFATPLVLEYLRSSPTASQIPDDQIIILLEKTFYYLVRYRYINFGLFKTKNAPLISQPKFNFNIRRANIVIVGSGMAGLTVARELANIFLCLPPEQKILEPLITVLEGRNRVGGRMYSFPIHSKFEGIHDKKVVDLAAMIVTGFQGGNPLDVIMRSQLKLKLHFLKSSAESCILHDTQGKVVTKKLDSLNEKTFNTILEAACNTIFLDGVPTVVSLEEKQKYLAQFAEKRFLADETLPSLGEVMEYYLQTSQLKYMDDMDLKLEFANATNLNNISLHHWDQDDGHEFGGEHCMVKGGYAQVPHAIMEGNEVQPPINVKLEKVVNEIKILSTQQKPDSSSRCSYPKGLVQVKCDDGSVYNADAVVVATPLGVLKSGKIKFDPPLPTWKTDPIQKMGYGFFNKVVLVFPVIFWDINKDIFGSLGTNSVNVNVDGGEANADRGKFFLFWNMVNTTGVPVLMAFVSGLAAKEMENMPDQEIIGLVMNVLYFIFKDKKIVNPIESVVTRWSRDEFTRGSYSYVANGSTGLDYDLLAKPLWNNKLHFAGEATNRYYPATVHGACISGLRTASAITDLLLGPLPSISPLSSTTGQLACCYRSTRNSKDPFTLPAVDESIFDHIHEFHSLLPERDGKMLYDLSFMKNLHQTVNEYGFGDILKSDTGCMLDIQEILQILLAGYNKKKEESIQPRETINPLQLTSTPPIPLKVDSPPKINERLVSVYTRSEHQIPSYHVDAKLIRTHGSTTSVYPIDRTTQPFENKKRPRIPSIPYGKIENQQPVMVYPTGQSSSSSSSSYSKESIFYPQPPQSFVYNTVNGQNRPIKMSPQSAAPHMQQYLTDFGGGGSDMSQQQNNHPVDKKMKLYETPDNGKANPGRVRRNYSKPQRAILNQWFQDNIDFPYPNTEDKNNLSAAAGISMVQLNVWFNNTRRKFSVDYNARIGTAETLDGKPKLSWV